METVSSAPLFWMYVESATALSAAQTDDAALKEVREAQAREAEARRERAEAARREERSRRRVHDTFFGRAHMI